jgi:hypothetical protein
MREGEKLLIKVRIFPLKIVVFFLAKKEEKNTPILSNDQGLGKERRSLASII